MTQESFNLAELQRDYDRYRERHGLPLQRVMDVQRDEFIAFHEEYQTLVTALTATHDQWSALLAEITSRLMAAGDGATVEAVATNEQLAALRQIATEHERLTRALGAPVRFGVTDDGEVWHVQTPDA